MSGFEKKTNDVTLDDGNRLPEIKTLLNASKLSIVEDRPIMMDYWTNSLEKSVIIGVKKDKKKMLIKNEDEYTSYMVYHISKKFIV